MNPGDLVEICCEQGDLISIGEDNGTAGRDFPVGTLCIYLGRSRGRLAVDILIDGAPGWVWKDEIKPATGATASVQWYNGAYKEMTQWTSRSTLPSSR